MKKYTQKYFKDLVRLGHAADVTHADAEAIKALAHKCEKVGYSAGIYGINGGLLQDPKTGERYVIIGRCSALFVGF